MFSTSIHSLITGKSSACLDSAIPALPGKSVRIASAVRECKFYFTYRPASCLKYSVREHYAYVSKNVLVACFVQPRVSLNELYIPATCHEIFHPMTVTIKRILYIYNHNTTNSMLCGLMLRKLKAGWDIFVGNSCIAHTQKNPVWIANTNRCTGLVRIATG